MSAVLTQALLSLLGGGIVGFTLGLIGGGGSILATPLMLYVVGLTPHTAIGTSALAVSANAFANFAGHARKGNVRWGSAILFAVFGMVGAAVGSTLGKIMHGRQLLFLFAILMIVVGALMLRPRKSPNTSVLADEKVEERPDAMRVRSMLPVVPAALLVGGLSGFFGIGGGFLIVPGLLVSTGMPMILAIGSSLLSVGTFGLTTAINYAFSGLVHWLVAAEFVAGGILGGALGMRLAIRLSPRRTALNRIFAGLVFVVALYMLYKNAPVAIGGRL